MKLPDQLKRKWERWKQSLPASVNVPRSILEFKVCVQKIDLQAFGDASKNGVCAAVYSVVHQSSGISQGLLCSKSRLSKQYLTIPRLGLVACHVSVNLLDNAKKAVTDYPIDKLVAWTDNSIALHWIRGNCNYKQFVKNGGDKIGEKKEIASQPAFTCSKLTIETLEQGVIGDVLVYLLLTLNIFHTLF